MKPWKQNAIVILMILGGLCAFPQAWYPEGSVPKSGDGTGRSLQKINQLLYEGATTGGGAGPSWFPEGSLPAQGDDSIRSLQKINQILYNTGGSTTGGGTGQTNITDSTTNSLAKGIVSANGFVATNSLYLPGLTAGSYARIDSNGYLTNSVRLTPVGASNVSVLGTFISDSLSTTNSINLNALTASRALVSDGSKYITNSAVTSTELGYVSGVTSAIQTQLNSKATVNGVANTVVSSTGTSQRVAMFDVSLTNLINGPILTTLSTNSEHQGDIHWPTGQGAYTQVKGPSDQPLAITATAPVQASSSVAGNGLTLTASAATAGSVTVGSAVGGAVTLVPGAASTMTITGTAGVGGAISGTGGAGGVNSFSGTATGGAGGGITWTTGAGGNATGASGTRTGGNSGALTLATGAAGTGASANGAVGSVVISPGGTTVGTFNPTSLVLAGGTGVASTPVLDMSQTWNAGGTTYSGIKLTVTYSAAAAASKLIDLVLAGTTRFSADVSGNVVATGNLTIGGNANSIKWTSSSELYPQSDGVVTLFNNARTGFGRLQFGGSTSSFGSLKQNGAGIDIRLADDSGYALLVSGGTTAAGNAAAGTLGEVISSLVAVGSPVALTTATGANVTSISLTAGDWDVEGNINFSASSATVTGTSGGITVTSATVPTDGSEVYSGVQVTVLSETDSVTIPRKRINVNATTTVYLVGKSTFSAGSVGAFGAITARRVR